MHEPKTWHVSSPVHVAQVLRALAAHDAREEQAAKREEEAETNALSELRSSWHVSQPRPATAGGGAPSPLGGGAAAWEAASAAASPARPATGALPRGGSTLVCTILSTWGDQNYFGLAGLQLLGVDGAPFELRADQLKADPADLNEMSVGNHTHLRHPKIVWAVHIYQTYLRSSAVHVARDTYLRSSAVHMARDTYPQ